MREYLNLSVCVDCLLWIANGDDADGAALDTDPDAARAEVAEIDGWEDTEGEDRADTLTRYLVRVDARKSWARNGWTLMVGFVAERPTGYPGPHPGGLDTPADLPRGADAADARKLAGDLRALADCAWAAGEGEGLAAESSALTQWGDRAADYADALELWTAEIEHGGSEGFSWSACGCCDSGLGGDRHRAAAVKF